MDTDPPRPAGDVPGPRPVPAGVSRAEIARGLLWLGLVLGTVGNLLATYGGATLPVHLAFGAVISYCLVGLVTQRLWRRA